MFSFRSICGTHVSAASPEAKVSAEPQPDQTTAGNWLDGFNFRNGTVPGTAHTRARINNQDAHVLRPIDILDVNGTRRQLLVGLVSDGCTGQKKRSRTEVGSALLSMYAFSEIRAMLALGVDIRQIPQQLYPRCHSWIGNIARLTVAGSVEEIASFIENFFLCTLLGFVMDESQMVTFSAGDGFFLVNDIDRVIDHQDAPLYPGYHQIDRSLLGRRADQLPDRFQSNVFDVAYLERLAVGTDGLLQRDPETKRPYLDTEDREAIFSHERGAKAGLQWWLNKQQNRHSRFSDDTTIITVERVRKGNVATKASAVTSPESEVLQ